MNINPVSQKKRLMPKALKQSLIVGGGLVALLFSVTYLMSWGLTYL